MKSDDTKENIMIQTIQLLEESNGNLSDITIRQIAKRCNIGVGLVNHYFTSKENLIETCVQSIINKVVLSYKPEKMEGADPIVLTKMVANHVADFLMDHKQIAKISIVGDLKSPTEEDNSMKTAYGFALCMSGGKNPDREVKKAFFLVAILQESFLRKDSLLQNIGVDFYDKKQREAYINSVVDMLIKAE